MADWEVLDVPPEIELASKKKNNEMETTEQETVEEAANERLCGYLYKCGAIGIKTWKRRWFVFEPRRCILYYYKSPESTESFGQIDIAKSTFSFSTNPGNKGQFEIRCGERVYQLQAADKDAMLFWVQQLKAERSKFMRLKCSMSDEHRYNSSVMGPTSGLLARNNEVFRQDSSDDLISFSAPIKKPASVGEGSKNENVSFNQSFGNFSLTNIKTEIKNWRRSGVLSGEPVIVESGEKSPTSTSSENKQPSQKNVKLRPNSRSYDFGFMGMAAGLKRRTFWGGQSTSQIMNSINDSCQECTETKEILSILKEAIQIAEKEIKTRDEVIESLHEQLRYAVMSKHHEKTSSPDMDPDSLEEKDSYIEKLSKMLKKQKNENEELQTRLDAHMTRMSEHEKKIDVLQEMIKNKDDEIVSLTNQIFTFENPDPAEDVLNENDSRQMQNESMEQLQDYQQLKESCTAYDEQNKLLNSEILELMKLRSMDEDIIKEKNVSIANLEAELCKIKSKYLIILKDFSIPLRDGYGGSERDYEMIQHLLDDAINESSEKKSSLSGANAKRASDRYGFYEDIDAEDIDSLQSFAEKLDEKSSAEATHGAHEMSTGIRWENFMVAQGKKPITKSEEVKSLIRDGIPHEIRPRVWKDLVSHYVQHEREIAGSGYYQSLLDEKQGVYTPAAKQIELDLLRTLPNNKYYVSLNSQGTVQLRNVLLAYSWHNPLVGYCQGLNRLGAIALLYLKEEDAFWCLVAIVEHLMPRDYYNKNLIGVQIDQRVFKDLLEEKVPKLTTHLQSVGVDLSLLSFNWFLAIFVDIFPVEMTLRVWDTFLFEGNKVLFRYSLAMFKSCEEDLLKFTDGGAIYSYFRRVPSSRMNANRISQIAFHQMNPLRKRNILSKRAHYMPILQAKLAEFESLRQSKKSERKVDDDNEIFSDGEDDE